MTDNKDQKTVAEEVLEKKYDSWYKLYGNHVRKELIEILESSKLAWIGTNNKCYDHIPLLMFCAKNGLEIFYCEDSNGLNFDTPGCWISLTATGDLDGHDINASVKAVALI